MLQAENIKLQLRKGKAFFSRKYPEMKYIAYFQSYTNTYAPLAHLRSLYEAALNEDDVVGISIATRPDCINEEILDYLSELSQHYFVTLEYGIESLNDETLLKIKRGHTVQCSIDAIKKTHQRGITTCAHMILGLPGETISDMQEQADLLFSLPIDIVKLHQLQITRGTALAQDCALQRQCTLFTPEEYIELVTYYIKHAKPDTIFERFTSQSPDSLLIAPRWGLKNHEFTNLLKLRLSKTNRKNED